jgi:signal transduction histidine kinase/DNA-binding response OmpR family regulator
MPAVAAEVADGDRVAVLAVDDDEKSLRAMDALLSGLPARVVLAHSGEDALRCLLREDFAVVVLDVQMPGLGGLETAAVIRSRPRSRRTPIIFLTAFGRDEAQLRRGYALGAVDFLTKPVVPEEILRDKVAWFVDVHRQAADLERERERARAAERREHERAIAEAKRRGEAEALRSEMARQRELVAWINRANERLRAVSSTSSELLLAAEPDEVLGATLERLSRQIGFEVWLLRVEGEGGLSLAAHGGVEPEMVPSIAALAPTGLTFAGVAGRPVPIVLEDVSRDGDRFPALRALRLRSAACFPLVAHRGLLGTLTFGTRRQGPLDPDDLAALALSADHVAMAVDRSRLIEELRKRAADLAAVDRRKDEFLAMLAHELRNPLAPVLGGIEILRQERATPKARRRALEAADRQVRHLARLVDDLVDVSRIRTGKVELRRTAVDLRRVIEDAVAAVEPLVRAQRQELRVEVSGEPLPLHGDPVRLTQILENLLHNSTKYTDPGGHIALVAGREGAEIVARVSDDGIGISAELLPRIFETFVQAKQPANRARGGLGIGLALVRSLVERHGGTVTATSPGPGLGSTFEVRLPAAAPAEAPAPEPRPAPASAAPASLRVAVIEDNPDIRETLRALLELRGYEVLEAEDGPAGVALVLARRPDVALVDIGLPGLDGYQVAERVRAAGTHLVALTGYGGAEDRNRAVSAGFVAHLVKPVEFESLARLLDELAIPERAPARDHPPLPGAQPCPTP